MAVAVHRAAFLRDINDPAEIAHLARLPVSVVTDALRTGALAGREFGSLGWRASRRSVIDWIEGRSQIGEAGHDAA